MWILKIYDSQQQNVLRLMNYAMCTSPMIAFITLFVHLLLSNFYYKMIGTVLLGGYNILLYSTLRIEMPRSVE